MIAKNKGIKKRLLWGFGAVSVLSVLLGTAALIEMNALSNLTEKLYNHPWTVSNAARDIRGEILEMHWKLREAAPGQSTQQLAELENDIKVHERKVFDLFGILSERFLGEKQEIETAHKTFSDWKNIRQEIIDQLYKGDSPAALEDAKSSSTKYVILLNGQIEKMGDFATVKAKSFYFSAQNAKKRIFAETAVMILLIFVVCLYAGMRITSGITGPVRNLIEQIGIIGKGNLDHKIFPVGDDEIGRIAQAFNAMTGELKETTVSRDAIDAANHQLRAANQQLHASEQQLRAANQQLQASEQQLRAATQQAQAANIAKSEFLANMSHEIRTPMNAILGFGELLSEEELAEDEKKEFLRIIKTSAQNLLKILDDVLDLSKVEAGEVSVENADFSLEEMLSSVKSIISLKAMEKGLDFRINTSDDLPDFINGDPTRIRQCLINLAGNAVKFTENGYVHLNVSLETEKGVLFIRFDVEDTGIGIPADKQELIFEPFQQADGSHTRKYGGTGLGLSITKQFIELLCGKLELASEEGKGSVFSMIMPANINIYPESSQGEEDKALEKDAVDAEFSGKVLVAEDTFTNLMLIKLLLEKAGFEVVTVNDGQEAIEKAMSEKFDLIFMDIQMPNINGYEATERLRREGVTTPIIAITAYAMKGDMEKCIAAGCDDYLSKPINRDKLMDTIRLYISSRDRDPDGRLSESMN